MRVVTPLHLPIEYTTIIYELGLDQTLSTEGLVIQFGGHLHFNSFT